MPNELDGGWPVFWPRGTLRTVEVNVLPHAAPVLPDAGFAKGVRSAATPGFSSLGQADVRDDRNVTHDSHVRATQRRGHAGIGTALLHVKIVFVKRHSLDQVTFRFRLKCRQVIGAKLGVGFPVAIDDRRDQPFGQVYDFLLVHGCVDGAFDEVGSDEPWT